MHIEFARPSLKKTGTLAVFAGTGSRLSESASQIDEATGGAVKAAIKASRFEGKKGQSLVLLAPAGVKAERVVLVGTGALTKMKPLDWESLGAGLYAGLATSGAKSVAVAVDHGAEAAAAIASGMALKSYRFDQYRTDEKPATIPGLAKAIIMTADLDDAASRYDQAALINEGVFLTRDLTSEPANVLHPESFAERVKKLKADGIKVTVLGEKQMEKLGMGALLGVGQGSARESKLAIMEWHGGKKGEAPLALVGKGVTFDTGGISLKPGAGMEDMKWDMGGAGIVTGTMKALALRNAKANVVGVIGLVENMPSSTAQRPGDVVTSADGQTIEVINTDAEGRLVLADALWYTQDKFKPKAMIDLATLTGAIIIALGHEHAGIFTDSDKMAKQLKAAGNATGDKVWRLPLHEAYDKQINSPIADMKNVGGRGAGSITAAQFLKRFVKNIPWVHIDVAAMVWSAKSGPLHDKGATGYGVRLLNRFIADNYED